MTKKHRTATAVDPAEYVLRGCAVCETWRPHTGTADAWRVWVARSTVEWAAESGRDSTTCRLETGEHYAICGDCTGHLVARQFEDAAARNATRATAALIRLQGGVSRELAAAHRMRLAWLHHLVQVAEPITLDQWRAERAA